jgi:hypothetical protein
MENSDLEKLRFPIGHFEKPALYTKEIVSGYIAIIAAFPEKLKAAVSDLDEEQLDTPYRDGGWTIRQVVHHCADSHMNSLIRFKLALTEETPIIKPYFENLWANLADSQMAIEPSLQILEGLHQRWGFLLNSLTEEELEKSFIHPEHGKIFQLKEVIGAYAWHCDHHLAHITELKKRKEW